MDPGPVYGLADWLYLWSSTHNWTILLNGPTHKTQALDEQNKQTKVEGFQNLAEMEGLKCEWKIGFAVTSLSLGLSGKQNYKWSFHAYPLFFFSIEIQSKCNTKGFHFYLLISEGHLLFPLVAFSLCQWSFNAQHRHCRPR